MYLQPELTDCADVMEDHDEVKLELLWAASVRSSLYRVDHLAWPKQAKELDYLVETQGAPSP